MTKQQSAVTAAMLRTESTNTRAREAAARGHNGSPAADGGLSPIAQSPAETELDEPEQEAERDGKSQAGSERQPAEQSAGGGEGSDVASRRLMWQQKEQASPSKSQTEGASTLTDAQILEAVKVSQANHGLREGSNPSPQSPSGFVDCVPGTRIADGRCVLEPGVLERYRAMQRGNGTRQPSEPEPQQPEPKPEQEQEPQAQQAEEGGEPPAGMSKMQLMAWRKKQQTSGGTGTGSGGSTLCSGYLPGVRGRCKSCGMPKDHPNHMSEPSPVRTQSPAVETGAVVRASSASVEEAQSVVQSGQQAKANEQQAKVEAAKKRREEKKKKKRSASGRILALERASKEGRSPSSLGATTPPTREREEVAALQGEASPKRTREIWLKKEQEEQGGGEQDEAAAETFSAGAVRKALELKRKQAAGSGAGEAQQAEAPATPADREDEDQPAGDDGFDVGYYYYSSAGEQGPFSAAQMIEYALPPGTNVCWELPQGGFADWIDVSECDALNPSAATTPQPRPRPEPEPEPEPEPQPERRSDRSRLTLEPAGVRRPRAGSRSRSPRRSPLRDVRREPQAETRRESLGKLSEQASNIVWPHSLCDCRIRAVSRRSLLSPRGRRFAGQSGAPTSAPQCCAHALATAAQHARVHLCRVVRGHSHREPAPCSQWGWAADAFAEFAADTGIRAQPASPARCSRPAVAAERAAAATPHAQRPRLCDPRRSRWYEDSSGGARRRGSRGADQRGERSA